MYPTTILEALHHGAWHEIGWRATSAKSTGDLIEHGRTLAAAGGHYRLVRPSVYPGGAPDVLHEYPARVSA